MAPLGARRLDEMVGLGERIAAIELLVAAQAVDLRRPPALGRATGELHRLIRRAIPFTGSGEEPPQDRSGADAASLGRGRGLRVARTARDPASTQTILTACGAAGSDARTPRSLYAESSSPDRQVPERAPLRSPPSVTTSDSRPGSARSVRDPTGTSHAEFEPTVRGRAGDARRGRRAARRGGRRAVRPPPRARPLPRRGPDGRRGHGAVRPRLPARTGRPRAARVLDAGAEPGPRSSDRRRQHDLLPRAGAAVRADRRRAPGRHDGRPRAADAPDAHDRRARHARAQHARAQRRPARLAPPAAGAGRDPPDRPRVGRRAVVGGRGARLHPHDRDRARRPRRRPRPLRQRATSTRRCATTCGCSRG